MCASRSPRAMRRVAWLRRLIGSAIRSAIQYPMPAPSRLNSTAPKTTWRSRVSICRSISNFRSGSGTVTMPSTSAGPDRGGGLQVAGIGELLGADERREPLEHDPPVDEARRSGRQQLRREQIPLARRLQTGPAEQVHVLIDGPADEHHDLIVDRRQRGLAALLQRRVVLDQPLRHGGRPGGGVFNSGPGLGGEVRPHGERENRDRHDGSERQYARNSLR